MIVDFFDRSPGFSHKCSSFCGLACWLNEENHEVLAGGFVLEAWSENVSYTWFQSFDDLTHQSSNFEGSHVNAAIMGVRRGWQNEHLPTRWILGLRIKTFSKTWSQQVNSIQIYWINSCNYVCCRYNTHTANAPGSQFWCHAAARL